MRRMHYNKWEKLGTFALLSMEKCKKIHKSILVNVILGKISTQDQLWK